MANTNLQRYKDMKFNTASPQELLLFTYDGTLKSLRRARKHYMANHSTKGNLELLTAMAGVNELKNTLNMEIQPIAGSLHGLYVWVLENIGRSLLDGSVAGIEEAIKIMGGLNEAWLQATAPRE